MKLSRFFFTALLALGGLTLQAADKPDVLFIAVDDLNDWTSYLGGHPQTKTPNIDRLVARGTAFTNSHCAAPACNPSRAALMSGLRPWTTGIYTNGDPAQDVLKDVNTINRHFLASGYNTLGGGKIYHNINAEGRKDTWTAWAGLFPSINEHEENMNGLKGGHFDWGAVDGKPSDMGDYKLTDWAINHLKTAPADKPLFLAVGYVKPHLPWYVPREYFDRFPLESIQLPTVKEDDLADIPKAGVKMAGPEGDHAKVLKSDQWKQAVQAYLATISFLDDQVGRLLDGLDASPRKDKTIIVWWTDHGWALGEKQHWRKFALWEETTRTSFAITAPGITKPGTTCTAPVDYTHVYPTLCELTGLSLPEHVKGPSLVPLLKDPKAAWDHVAVCSHGKGNHSARDSQWRYIRYADGSEELYDHSKDPYEWTNLASETSSSEVKARLATVFPKEEAKPTSGGKGGNADGGEKPRKGKGKNAKKKAE
ncbi:MAG: sulfatase [Verrucomicrobiota bacterium]